MKKSIITFILFLLIVSGIHAESYQIEDVSYDIKGSTREYALTQKVHIDTKTIFTSYTSFEEYVNDLRQRLQNQRVFQETDIEVTYPYGKTGDPVKVNLIIKTEDTLNIIAVPYPSYDSNTGFTLKLKIKDYNFFGSMETMDFDLNYQAKSSDGLDDIKHAYGLNFDFSIPFSLFSIPFSWNNSFEFEYTAGESNVDMEICEGISFDIPIADITKAKIGFNQYYIQNSEYEETHDDTYFKEELSLSFPFLISHLAYWDDIVWTPYTEYTYNWDFDAFEHTSNSGIIEQKLLSPELIFGHSFSAGRINWISNFRDGFEGSLKQTFGYNFAKSQYVSQIKLSTQYHKNINSFIGFSSREYLNIDLYNEHHKFGSMVRGIRDNDYKSSSFLLLNLDLPIKVFHTDWRSLFGWDKLKFIDFEFQFSPFQDIVIGENQYAGSKYSLKDAWYGTGFEMIVFPDRFRSIQGRISFGVDSVRFLQKLGNKVNAFDGLADTLFNTSWRNRKSSGWYELSIGIGLFY